MHEAFENATEREEQALQELLAFPFVDALFGRRSRRFFRGAEGAVPSQHSWTMEG